MAWMRGEGFLLVGVLVACMPQALADIRNTGHNLARYGAKATDANATCVFCHTPLASGSGDEGPPAWQSALPRTFAYGAIESIAAQIQREAGPPSLVCLSCHDANQARAAADPRQDHPFSVPFRGKASVLRSTVPAGNADLVMSSRTEEGRALDYRTASSGQVDDRIVWWVATSGSQRRSRSDLPLYGRPGPNGNEIPYIECASCHDPHADTRQFLRISNEGSRLCLSCHVL